jgi:hypothetical protein
MCNPRCDRYPYIVEITIILIMVLIIVAVVFSL